MARYLDESYMVARPQLVDGAACGFARELDEELKLFVFGRAGDCEVCAPFALDFEHGDLPRREREFVTVFSAFGQNVEGAYLPRLFVYALDDERARLTVTHKAAALNSIF